MSVFGIVSEFNPFHLGHEYLIRSARDMGADSVVCVMSGNATQRGELAITDKYTRAEAALCGGADLVLELPFPWSSASAESFALAGISVLNSFCDTVIFGSECGDIELLKKIAELHGIDMKNTIVAGDNDNDVSMLEVAGVGVAVSNASPAAKKAANYHTVSNEEHAIARIIKDLEEGKLPIKQ